MQPKAKARRGIGQQKAGEKAEEKEREEESAFGQSYLEDLEAADKDDRPRNVACLSCGGCHDCRCAFNVAVGQCGHSLA